MNNKKVLLIRLSALGDVIFNIPLANILKSNGYKVSWLTSEKGFDIINNNPCVDEVILAPVEKWKKQDIFRNFKEYFKIIKHIRTQNFDIAIDTQGLLKTFIWTAFCGAKRRIISKSAREGAIFAGNEVIEKLYTSWETHVTLDYLKFAKYLGLETNMVNVSFPKSLEKNVLKVNELMREIDITKPVVTICPATTWKAKHWNIENWKGLISKLKDNYNLIFTGTSKDIKTINYIAEDCNSLNLAGKTNLLELCEVFKRSDLVISLDSGSTHLAWATQVPKIISIFCCTPKSRYAPLGSASKYIALQGDLSCQPCHKKHCINKDYPNACTQYPTVEEVFEAVKKLLN